METDYNIDQHQRNSEYNNVCSCSSLWYMIHTSKQDFLYHGRRSSCSNGWSDLPWDLLDRILQHLELPESLAVAAVCAPWRSAAVASGVPPRSRTPWLASRVLTEARGSSTFRNLLDAGKTRYKVSLPQGRRHLAWCGASHGWLVASDELCSLLLCNPFTLAVIPLPPTTALGCVKETDIIQFDDYIGCWFYLKVVLSCDLSHGDDYIAMAIYGNNKVAFARAGESTWRLVSEMPWQNKNRTFSEKGMDLYADCVSHNGRFYAVTMCGAVEAWDLSTEEEPSREAIIAAGDGRYWSVLTRFLVSTPWGALLQIRTQRRRDHRGKIKVVVLQVDVEERRLVSWMWLLLYIQFFPKEKSNEVEVMS
ncbi:hypothetical protein QYE76_007540 [Lolium multiflorum]|uniref:F-box domain-containing protein n=1 Tax=Lolium multiflorum TaxID=4521 RepID=A0AAD8VDV2_LOLMU|nr:hypothetical protein QYE76_016596 [Lolium multiflorum]KAK1600998.1 hypothetical protein QYE76_007540 [Lolium multiflorum]